MADLDSMLPGCTSDLVPPTDAAPLQFSVQWQFTPYTQGRVCLQVATFHHLEGCSSTAWEQVKILPDAPRFLNLCNNIVNVAMQAVKTKRGPAGILAPASKRLNKKHVVCVPVSYCWT